MKLKNKKYFYFTQNSLSTFVNCPFKFKKKYIDNVKWREDDEVSDEKIKLGTDFHKIAERYFKQIPVYEESFSNNEILYTAYKNLKDSFPLNCTRQYYPEYTIRFSDEFMRLEANIDLIIIKDDGTVEIWDWKTSANTNSRSKYEKSLQTLVYMWVLKTCSEDIFGVDFDCKNIKMIYFSPEQNIKIAEISYSDKSYKKSGEDLKSLLEKVYNYNYEVFNREKYKKQCKFCEFNMFCNSQKDFGLEEFAEWNLDEIEEVF